MDYQYRVHYRDKGIIKNKLCESIKQICLEFRVNRDLVKNLYMDVPKIQHHTIISIERLPVPIKTENKIVIKFN